MCLLGDQLKFSGYWCPLSLLSDFSCHSYATAAPFPCLRGTIHTEYNESRSLWALSVPGDCSDLPAPAASPAFAGIRGYLKSSVWTAWEECLSFTQQSCLQRKLVVATVHGVAKSQTRLSNCHFHLGANQ